MNLYQTTKSLPQFSARYFEISNEAQYNGEFKKCLNRHLHVGRCDTMYNGADYMFQNGSAVYCYSHVIVSPISQQRVNAYRYLINGEFIDIISNNAKLAYRVAWSIARMPADVLDTSESWHCALNDVQGSIVWDLPFLWMLHSDSETFRS
jgi:hypothetical protein